jgi:hypothetical protein
MPEADQWDRVLANVKGTIVRGTERVSCHRLLDLLNVEADPAVRARVAKWTVSPMRALGWEGPCAMRIPGEDGHGSRNGYWRSMSPRRQAAVHVEGDVEVEVDADQGDDLAERLEAVTRQGLRKLSQILWAPLDVTDASLTRSQVTAAGVAINAQLRADEQRLKAKVQGDVLGRLLAIIEEERRRRELEGAGEKAAESLPRGHGDEDRHPEDAGEAS